MLVLSVSRKCEISSGGGGGERKGKTKALFFQHLMYFNFLEIIPSVCSCFIHLNSFEIQAAKPVPKK